MTDVKEKEMVQVSENKSWDEILEKEPFVNTMADVYETDDEYVINAYMPGVKKEDVKIKLEEGSLTLMGRVDLDSLKDRKYTIKEVKSGNFFRRFRLTDGIDEERIDARLENGILNVTLPKHERIKPKTIAIK